MSIGCTCGGWGGAVSCGFFLWTAALRNWRRTRLSEVAGQVVYSSTQLKHGNLTKHFYFGGNVCDLEFDLFSLSSLCQSLVTFEDTNGCTEFPCRSHWSNVLASRAQLKSTAEPEPKLSLGGECGHSPIYSVILLVVAFYPIAIWG